MDSDFELAKNDIFWQMAEPMNKILLNQHQFKILLANPFLPVR